MSKTMLCFTQSTNRKNQLKSIECFTQRWILLRLLDDESIIKKCPALKGMGIYFSARKCKKEAG